MPLTATASPYEACTALFNDYPQAVRDDALALFVPGDQPYACLVEDCRDAGYFSIYPWAGSIPVVIEPGAAGIPAEFSRALTSGVPVPRDGSVYGWADKREITTLVVFYIRGDMLPSFCVMPLAGLPRGRRARFAAWFGAEPQFGYSFWTDLAAGRVIRMGPVIAATRDTVFWSARDVPGGDGAGIIAVRDPVPAGGRLVLPPGVYADVDALDAGVPLPSLEEALADPDKVDLWPRFPRAVPTDCHG